ncbi:ABC transporter permease [Bacteroides gallinaceum]|uniref:ABC transporter permease n=1 Tax=Bacteroides gallinaceum TaxID=1462571 RepID=UPI0025AA800F|nr:ABC transporter permease [Bacteroides gallinaceum]MDN0065481.1 ABC transporter permease [Bacteroides gallinaceum]MDN0078038.1 ABC transporter permease [Bacteroides gallinaceum]
MIWKLLKQHISLSQLLGFSLANVCGMVIVLLAVQFYRDVLPMFTQENSFLKGDYIIISKKVSTLGTIVGKQTTFSAGDIAEIEEQPFVKRVGSFLPSQFKVMAGMGLQGIKMSTDLFFESVPDAYVDVQSEEWKFNPESNVIPIIIPRNYLNLYNFGFAQSRNLPQLSEGIIGMVNLDIRLVGNGKTEQMKGHIVGFSSRLNTILVPESFIRWANARFSTGVEAEPSRLIVEVGNPADERIVQFVQRKGYEMEGNELEAGKTVWFLKLIVGVVLSVGLLISVLSFYILILSIYLLLQKNMRKLETLLLIGYSPAQVARPYQMLAVVLNLSVLLLGIAIVIGIRGTYLPVITSLLPDAGNESQLPALLTGACVFLLVSVLNIVMVRRKVDGIWMHKK